MIQLKINDIQSVSDDGKMILSGENDTFTYEGIDHKDIISSLSRILDTPIPVILRKIHEMNPNLPADFYTINCDFNEVFDDDTASCDDTRSSR